MSVYFRVDLSMFMCLFVVMASVMLANSTWCIVLPLFVVPFLKVSLFLDFYTACACSAECSSCIVAVMAVVL